MQHENRFLSVMAVVLLFLSHSPAQPRILNAAEIQLALKRLTVLGSALFIAAHPDDENTAFLAYMTQGKLTRAAYLAMTRGEGGQNLIGPEQGDLMGVIRTQELLAARNIDGAEQYFTRAIDFGYSKTTDETIQFWGRGKTLADVVWIIRKFRPDVIVSRFTSEQGGHGNHTASAVFAYEAFSAAVDPNRFPEQLKYVRPWQAKRLVWNVFRFQQTSNPSKPENSVTLDLGSYNNLLGKSYTEISGESRSMHKSQGFGARQNRGELVNYFQHVAGEAAKEDLFDGVNTTWSRIQGGETVGRLLEQAYSSFNPQNPSGSITSLFRAYYEMSRLSDPWVDVKKKEIENVIQSCAGVWIDALSTEYYSAVPGSELKLRTVVINRSEYPFTLERITIPFGSGDTLMNSRLSNNMPVVSNFTVNLRSDIPYTQPFWLQEAPEIGSYVLPDQRLIGLPENIPALSVKVTLAGPDGKLEFSVPVRYQYIDPVEGELYRPFEIVPAVALNLTETVYVFPDHNVKKIEVNLRSGGVQVNGKVRLKAPSGWIVKPESIPFGLKARNEEQFIAFHVTPSNGAVSGMFSVEAEVGGKRIHQGIRTIQYQHIPPQTLFPVAEGKLLRMDVKKKGHDVGYIMGAGDDIPAALRQVGYSITLISDEEIAEGNLSKYHAIVAGVRAYNTRPKLRTHQKRLMEYVEKGGTYIVQYVTMQRGESENIGPYPITISRDRVTVEDAPVTFVNPKHMLLNVPNKITPDDFKGWVQERGLYFANKWDTRYDSVLVCNDPGEEPKAGGLLIARHGKGYYIYTGYAFFRQLPAGVPGAYRLFLNMVSVDQFTPQEKAEK